MIRLITGKKGSGKTKIIIDRINAAVKRHQRLPGLHRKGRDTAPFDQL